MHAEVIEFVSNVSMSDVDSPVAGNQGTHYLQVQPHNKVILTLVCLAQILFCNANWQYYHRTLCNTQPIVVSADQPEHVLVTALQGSAKESMGNDKLTLPTSYVKLCDNKIDTANVRSTAATLLQAAICLGLDGLHHCYHCVADLQRRRY